MTICSHRIFTILFALSILGVSSRVLTAQNNYELLFLNEHYDSILIETSELRNVEDYIWRSTVLQKQGYSKLAADLLSEGYERFPENIALQKRLAQSLFQTGQFAASEPLLRLFVESPEYFLMLIEILEFEDNHREAIVMLEDRITKDSTNDEYIVRLADNLYQIDSLTDAMIWYQRALRINPGDIVSMSKLANIHLILKDYNGSIAICDEALVIDSTNRRFIRIRALASFRKGDFQGAAKDFTTLHQQGDSSFTILKHLGISESKSYAYHSSRKHLLLAYDKDSTDQEVCFFLGRGFLNSTEPERGLYFLEKAEELLNPDPLVLAAIYLEKVSIYSSMKMYDEVLDLYLRAYRINPRPDYLFYLGSLYEHRFNEKKKALDYYERFLADLPPRDTPYPPTRSGQQALSMKNVAEGKVEELKEELFFNGELDNED